MRYYGDTDGDRACRSSSMADRDIEDCKDGMKGK